MVWFQCEDCGDNLKKPKLPNHFRICSASKLSCIDCGQIFGQQSVEGHTQCISEAEKYGPKGQGKSSNGTVAKPDNNSKQKPDVDINVGLSERPPWFCSLCNTKTTSKQTQLLHADGKRHRAKAKAFHLAKQPERTKDPAPNTESATQSTQLSKEQYLPELTPAQKSIEADNNTVAFDKKRKNETTQHDDAKQAAGINTSHELGNGEVIHAEKEETMATKSQINKAKNAVVEDDDVVHAGTCEHGKKKIKWKKLITSALRSNPDGALKMKKLKRIVLKTLRESGFIESENELLEMLENKINSSSRFTVDGKYIHLAAKS